HGKSSRLFPTACALFAKKTGVYPSSLFPSSIFNFPFSNLFRINTYASVCKETVLTLFRMNTYAKTGGGGGWDLVPSETQGHETCATEFAARGILASLRHCFLTSPFSSGFRRRREKPDRQVPRSPQSRRRTQNHRNRVDRHARRRNISMRPARNHERNIRMSRQRNRVRRIFRANVHLQFHVNQFFAAAQAARNLVYARRLSRLDRHNFRRHFFRRHFRFNRLGALVPGQSQAVRHTRPRLRQS